MKKRFQITEYCQNFLKSYIREGDICIDATVGNGGDTEFLCTRVGEAGRVYGFDIQPAALEHTKERLEQSGLSKQAVLIRDGHERMEQYVKEKAAAIMFNLGYLPGADHKISTKAETSLLAVKIGMKLLRAGGVMSLCIYSGGDTGYEEKNTLLPFLKGLDPKQWLVLVHEFYNRKNDPPLPVFLIKLED